MPLFTSGRISSSIAAAEARERGVGAQVTAATADVKLAVADAYVDVLRARKAHGVASSNVQTLEALTRDTTSMFERELVPKNDLLAVQVALADARQNELRAANAAEVAARRLQPPPWRAAGPAGGVERDARRACGAVRRTCRRWWSRRSRGARNSTRSTRRRSLRPARAHRALARTAAVALSGGYQYLENQFLDDETVGMAGIGVQWAMFDGGQSRKRAAALDRNRRATEQQRADASSQIELQVRQAYLGIQESRQRVSVTAQAAEQADENLRIARERYTAGLGTQTQLLAGGDAAGAGAQEPGRRRRWTPDSRSCGSRARSGRSEATGQRGTDRAGIGGSGLPGRPMSNAEARAQERGGTAALPLLRWHHRLAPVRARIAVNRTVPLCDSRSA